VRKVNPNSISIPNEINYSSISTEIAAISVSATAVNDKIYKGTTKVARKNINKVSIALKEKYKNKCGYCESFEFDPQVEHHRPKGFVTGGGNKAGGFPNDGYHWLAYEWTNMVASCARCNGRKYKGTKFPVKVDKLNRRLLYPGSPGSIQFSSYRYNSTFLKSEKPLILHPEYCIPSKHFEFDRNGKINGKTERGKTSINVYGLDDETNDANRLIVYKGFLDQFDKIVLKHFRKNKPFSREVFKELLGELYSEIVIRGNDDNENFTLFTKDLYKRFYYYFIDTIPKTTMKNQVKAVFKEVLNEIK
jgi:hypothetical protein